MASRVLDCAHTPARPPELNSRTCLLLDSIGSGLWPRETGYDLVSGVTGRPQRRVVTEGCYIGPVQFDLSIAGDIQIGEL